MRSRNNKEVLSEIIKHYSFSEIFCDVNIRKPFSSSDSILFCLSNATILKISLEEITSIMDVAFGATVSVEEVGHKLHEQYEQLKIIIITMGENGAVCYDCVENKNYRCNSYPTNVVSTVGAGDSFGAAFLTKYLKGEKIMECLEFASKISAFVCSKKEAVPKELVEYVQIIE